MTDLLTRGAGPLKSQLPGRVSLPGEEAYGVSAPWDEAVPVHPAAVVAPTSAEEVALAVGWAAENGYRVAVQATGHGAVALGGDALLVHTGQLQTCAVDPTARTVRVGAGVTWRQVLDAVTPFGLAPVCGSSANVGAVGYLTGGGIGPLVKALGVSSDYIVSAEVVTGDGQLRRVNEHDEPDLFWAVRGGKSALGIVTQVELRLLPIRTLYGGCLFFPDESLADLVTTWRDWAGKLPVEATTSLAVLQLPDLPSVPPPLAGRCSIAVRYASLADHAQAAEALVDLTTAVVPIFGGAAPMGYRDIAGIHADPTVPAPTVNATALLPELPDEALQQLTQLSGPGSGSPQTIVEIRQLGGSYNAPTAGPSSFDARAAAFNLYVSGDPRRAPSQVLADHGARLVAAIAPPNPNKLVNFVNSGDPKQLRHCYHRATRDRLLELTHRYDPGRTLCQPLHAAVGHANEVATTTRTSPR